MKLLISGGHPSPAFAVIDTLQQQNPDVEIVFVGRIIAQHATGQPAGEKEAMELRGIPFYSIDSPKWGRTLWQKVTALFSVFSATLAAYRLLKDIKPDVFLSFGSYVAVPVAIACVLHNIPVVTHEQTRVAGISNRTIARFATVVAISYQESKPYFPLQKTILTGLPLRPQLFSQHVSPPVWANADFLDTKLPVVYVTGGSTGSHVINELISDMLPLLLKKYRVVHPCGRAHNDHDWPKLLLAKKQLLSAELQARYILLEQLNVDELAWLYHQPLVVFGRSGANTTAEVAAFGLKAIFVPLPHSNYDEQHKNAQALVESNQALIIEQHQLDQVTLTAALEKLLASQVQQKTSHLPTDSRATSALIHLVFQTYQKKK